jgi:hypothetical protein
VITASFATRKESFMSSRMTSMRRFKQTRGSGHRAAVLDAEARAADLDAAAVAGRGKARAAGLVVQAAGQGVLAEGPALVPAARPGVLTPDREGIQVPVPEHQESSSIRSSG